MARIDSVGMSRDELYALPAAVSLETACRAVGLGRNKGYRMARDGQFPVRVLTLGKSYRVSSAELLEYLGLDVPEAPIRAS